MTADTFFTVVNPVESARIYEIRLCAEAASPPAGQ
jgi:hypothetical protein